MGRKLDIQAAAWVTGRSHTTIRKWIETEELPAARGIRRGGTRAKPGMVRRIDADELRRVHERHGGTIWREGELAPDVEDLAERLASVEHELAALRASRESTSLPRAQRRSRAPDVLAQAPLLPDAVALESLEAIDALKPGREAMPPRAARPLAPLSPRQRRGKLDELPPVPEEWLHLDELPATWSTVMSYATGHGARETQRSTFTKSKRLDVIRSEYRTLTYERSGRRCHRTVTNVLDEARMARFHELWHDRDWWRAMPGCALCQRGEWANHEAITSSTAGATSTEASTEVSGNNASGA